MTYKNKSFMTKKKAFTLIELLIVIAIIGILFIVLVSKVDFATDKAKATGVQTDFRSFQVAIESVAKENSGLATFGWDTGDTNGDRIRNSYDKGDTNKNGVQDDGEIFVGSKTYGETWTNVYTLTNPADANDKSAIAALEEAINKNLDPKLHITIADDLTITMANGAQDPWKTEYHGYYITNATMDNKDRGAIVMYSDGANQENGSEHSIANGIVTVNVPDNNVYGKDDYSIAVVYTYVNGYGEVKTTTTGFSNNQGGGQAGSEGTFVPGGSGSGNLSDNIKRHESGLPYDMIFYSIDGNPGTGIQFCENGTCDMYLIATASEGPGHMAISVCSLIELMSDMDPDNALIMDEKAYTYTINTDGEIIFWTQIESDNLQQLKAQYNKTNNTMTIIVEDSGSTTETLLSNSTFLKPISYDKIYYRAGDEIVEEPSTLLFKEDGSIYEDDKIVANNFVTKKTFMFPVVDGDINTNKAYILSLDGTCVSDGNNFYYLEDYSHEHIHDKPIFVGTETIHSKIECCNIINSEHNMKTTLLIADNCSVYGKTKYTCECGYNYSDEKTLNDYSWEEIQQIAKADLDAGTLENIYGIELGQYKDDIYQLVDLYGNNYDGFVFMMRTTTIPSIVYTNVESNEGGYANTNMPSYLENIYNSLEDQTLKSVIKNVSIHCNDKKEIYFYNCHMFLASAVEIGFMTSGVSDDPEISKYFGSTEFTFKYFYSQYSRNLDPNSTLEFWWLRTTTTYSDHFVCVDPNGERYNALPWGDEYHYNIVPFFVVG